MKIPSILAGIALAASALPAQAADPAPSNLGCLLRTMEFSLMAKAASERADAKAEDKAKSAALAAGALESSYYYLGLLGANWAKTSHAAEGDAEFKAMRALPNEQRAREILACIGTARSAQQQALAAMAPPKK